MLGGEGMEARWRAPGSIGYFCAGGRYSMYACCCGPGTPKRTLVTRARPSTSTVIDNNNERTWKRASFLMFVRVWNRGRQVEAHVVEAHVAASTERSGPVGAVFSNRCGDIIPEGHEVPATKRMRPRNNAGLPAPHPSVMVLANAPSITFASTLEKICS